MKQARTARTALVLGLTLGCGGHSSFYTHKDEATDGGEPGSLVGSSGALQGGGGSRSTSGGHGPSRGGNPSRGGTGQGGASEPPRCVGPPPEVVCIENCDIEGSLTTGPTCLQGLWECAPPLGPLDTCPLDSCARDYARCCDSVTGTVSYRDCLVSGRRQVCEPGYHLQSPTEPCTPAGVDVSTCDSGLPCPMPGYECHARARSCRCGDANLPVWQCEILIP